MIPGEVLAAEGTIELNPGRDRIERTLEEAEMLTIDMRVFGKAGGDYR